MEKFGWVEGLSKKTGKKYWANREGKTQWEPPNLDNELKKYNLLQQYENSSSQSLLPLVVKHLLCVLCTFDYKDLEHTNYKVLDVGSCHANKHKAMWELELCSLYECMDIKPSDFKGNMLAPILWQKVKEPYDIICLFDCLQCILFDDDFEILFKNILNHLKDNGRIICFINKNLDINLRLKMLQGLGFKISLEESVSKLLCLIGVDSEKINEKRQFDWDLFFKSIIKRYNLDNEETLTPMEWYYSSLYKILIIEKQSSNEILQLHNDLLQI